MFANNKTRKATENLLDTECMCSLFQTNTTINNKEGFRAFNNTPRSKLNVSKNSEQSKKLSISSFIRDKQKFGGRGSEIKSSGNYSKQQVAGYENDREKCYYQNKILIDADNSQFQRLERLKQAPQIISVTQSAAYLEPMLTHRPTIYHRKIIQQPTQLVQPVVVHQSIMKISEPLHYNRPQAQFMTVEKRIPDKNLFERTQYASPQTPLHAPQRSNLQHHKSIKQQPQIQEIVQSKASKGGVFSTQSTDINKESKHFSHKQNQSKYFLKQQFLDKQTYQEAVPFMSEIEPITPKSQTTSGIPKFRSIQSINNTNFDIDSLNVSIVVEKPQKFARLQRPRARTKKDVQQVSVQIEKEKWKQFEDYLLKAPTQDKY